MTTGATAPAPSLELDQHRAVRFGQRLAELGDDLLGPCSAPSSASLTSRWGSPIWAFSDRGVSSATSLPKSMIPTRSASWSASSRYWVVRKTVVPSGFSFSTSVQIVFAADRVETGGRLVEEQHRRLVDERRGEVQAPTHAPRVRPDLAVGGLDQVDALQQRVRSATPLVPRQPVQRRLQADQLAPGHQRVERRLLEGDADRPAHLAGLGDDVEPRHPGAARRWAAAAWSGSEPWSSCRPRSVPGRRRSRPPRRPGRRRRRPARPRRRFAPGSGLDRRHGRRIERWRPQPASGGAASTQARSVARSSASAASRSSSSWPQGAISWSPIGSPSEERPTGTLIAGTPARLASPP